ncbi:hypothetical protein [Bathymodiolus japonicus methanotrophic gill symbiont]|uniref:hypothetical protein n=1 Tax=Bathymodiolus japonicus methanotrophic gill symbiont TaxID=113269 RepID=UPI001C8DB2A1|nr:hypothetical protein [Bathymodiolus japonicus methanotrophic gill symbiont]
MQAHVNECPATFIQSYIDDLNDALNQLKPGAALTRIQAAWLGTCLTGILLMNSVCWAKFERASLLGSRYFCESLFWASQPKQAAKT